MGKVVDDKPCPKCREQGRDSTGNHLMVFDDGGTFCNRCGYKGKADDNTVNDRPDKQRKIGKVSEIQGFKCGDDSSRGIRAETGEHFGVKHGFDESNGLHDSTFYPMHLISGDLVAYKERTLPKGFHVQSDRKMRGVDIQFFGQTVCPQGGKKLLITGGEEDAMAAWEMLKDRYPKYNPAVVSLPNGENLNCVSANRDFLDSFEEVLVATDMDKAGRKVCDDICKMVGERCRVVSLGEKDASDMKVKGKEKDFINAYFNAKEYRPSTIVLIEDIIDDIVKPVPWGLSYPFPELTQITYGMKEEGEIICLGAGPGAGKSTFFHALQTNLVFDHNEDIVVFDMEEGAVKAAKKLVGNIIGRPIHKPDCTYDQELARSAAMSISGRVEFYDGHPEWPEVKDNIRYFASKGIRFFFIDPVSTFAEGKDPSKGNEILGEMMKDLIKFKKELGLTFFHANHLNNPQSGADHGAGGKVYGSQIRGSRAQWFYSTLLLGLTRNQLAEDEEEKNLVTLSVIKDRLGGNTGSFQLKYNAATGKLEEIDYELPT